MDIKSLYLNFIIECSNINNFHWDYRVQRQKLKFANKKFAMIKKIIPIDFNYIVATLLHLFLITRCFCQHLFPG